ncbi:MAG: rhodanese-like domain-containing protein [Burkholderiales bacterium]|nr:rhodanese-like domain-containing protein [Burkholderiales bacterium]GIK86264.1 MAG: sulfurtransferase [Betaproteobacteria bacterium]
MSRPPAPPDWAGLHARVAQDFPDVDTIDAAALARRLADGEPLLLVDVRTPQEQAVSTIPGAVCVAPSIGPDGVAALAKDTRPIVVYCAAGVRSARLARALVAAGATEVRNLDGGIFAWANEGRPLAGPDGPAQRVHGCDAQWERLLAPERRA